MSEKYNIPEENSLDSMEGVVNQQTEDYEKTDKSQEEIISQGSLQKIKEDYRKKYFINEKFISKLDEDEREFTLKRYENALDCATKLTVLFDQYPEDVVEEMRIRPYSPIIHSQKCLIEKSMLHNDSKYNYAGSGPFTGVKMHDASMKTFEKKAFEFNPDIVIPTMSSAVLPSIMLKCFFEYLHNKDEKINDPYFIIPGRGSDSKYSVNFSGAKNVIEKSAKSGEVKVLIVDDYVSTGKTLNEYKRQVMIGLRLPQGVKLSIETFNFGTERLLHSGDGWLKKSETRGYSQITTHNSSNLKSGALPWHHLQRKFFEIWGEHFAKDFELVQEFKNKFSKNVSS